MVIVQKSSQTPMGFGDDVIAEQPSHPCLVIHNTVCHVTLCALFLDSGWNSVPSRNDCCDCGVNAIHSESVCLYND